MNKKLLLLIFILLTSIFYYYLESPAISNTTESDTWTLEGIAMTVPYHLNLPINSSLETQKLAKQILDESFASIDRIYNCYNPYSELSKLNRYRSTSPFPLSKDLYSYLIYCDQLYQKSNGFYDPTLRKAKLAWIDVLSQGRVLSDYEIEDLRSKIGWNKIILSNQSCQKLNPSIEIDLCGSIKGFCVDQVKDTLIACGITDFLFEWGGEITASGKASKDRNWTVLIESTKNFLKHDLIDTSIASSGSKYQIWEVNNKKYTHIINPKTLMPLLVDEIPPSITIEHKSCCYADALTTAGLCMSKKKREKWINQTAITYWVQSNLFQDQSLNN